MWRIFACLSTPTQGHITKKLYNRHGAIIVRPPRRQYHRGEHVYDYGHRLRLVMHDNRRRAPEVYIAERRVQRWMPVLSWKTCVPCPPVSPRSAASGSNGGHWTPLILRASVRRDF